MAVIGARGRLGAAACAILERAGPEAGLELVGRFTREDPWPRLVRELQIDVALEATRAGLGREHGLVLLEAGAHVVIATSGVEEQDEILLDRRARELGRGGLIVPNFSLGAALLMREAARLAPHFAQVEIIERHHARKLDAPSATARETARRIVAARGAQRGSVPIHSVRLDGLQARQEVQFGSPGETLTLVHDVSSPEAYGPGILSALRCVAGRLGVARGIEHAFDLPP